MNLAVGVIGAGIMGTEHARILCEDTPGARLAAICDADAVNRQCFADQAARIEALGGIDVCRNAHLFNHTPTPAEQAAMREDGR